jgi:hypothetical protein
MEVDEFFAYRLQYISGLEDLTINSNPELNVGEAIPYAIPVAYFVISLSPYQQPSLLFSIIASLFASTLRCTTRKTAGE